MAGLIGCELQFPCVHRNIFVANLLTLVYTEHGGYRLGRQVTSKIHSELPLALDDQP